MLISNRDAQALAESLWKTAVYCKPKIEPAGYNDPIFDCPVERSVIQKKIVKADPIPEIVCGSKEDFPLDGKVTWPEGECVQRVVKEKLAPIERAAEASQECNAKRDAAVGESFDGEGKPPPDLTIDVDAKAELFRIDIPPALPENAIIGSYEVNLAPLKMKNVQGTADVFVEAGDGKATINVQSQAQLEVSLQKFWEDSINALGKKAVGGKSLEDLLGGSGVTYGPRIIKSSGVCTSTAEQAAGINRGETLKEAPGIVLKGTNILYNFFTLDAEDSGNNAATGLVSCSTL
eukprot:Skav222188  [mRNA]  locus=scaffold3784:143879:154736:- [translate_table: standard]